VTVNPLEQTPENAFDQAKHDRWLRQRYTEKDWNGLFEAALLLNTLYHMERTKSRWAIKEAANNLSEMCGLDRDSA
jgi:hypothetical protein